MPFGCARTHTSSTCIRTSKPTRERGEESLAPSTSPRDDRADQPAEALGCYRGHLTPHVSGSESGARNGSEPVGDHRATTPSPYAPGRGGFAILPFHADDLAKR